MLKFNNVIEYEKKDDLDKTIDIIFDITELDRHKMYELIKTYVKTASEIIYIFEIENI